MNILIWAPFIQKVGTTTNVEGLINSLTKYSKNYQIDLINVFGEWDDYKFESENVKKISLLKLNFIKENKKSGFIRSRLYTIIIILRSFLPLIRLLKKKKLRFYLCSFNYFTSNFISWVNKKKNQAYIKHCRIPKINFFTFFFLEIFWKKYF